MESTTLHFDNARAAASLYHNDERLLREMEQELGVLVASRDGWIRIEGKKDKLERASLIFTQLDEARHHGFERRLHPDGMGSQHPHLRGEKREIL